VASFNRVLLIGRLTRDPEVRAFANGGKVAKFGFAVSGQRKKNPDTGQWEDEPCFLDVEAFNKGDHGKAADLVENYLSKGKQVFIEGHLRMDSWTAKDGTKRNKIIVVVDALRFLEPKAAGEEIDDALQRRESVRQPARAGGRIDEDVTPAYAPDGTHEDIPFSWLIGFVLTGLMLCGLC